MSFVTVQKYIFADEKKILYTLRKTKRARRMRLAVHRDGSVTMTTPLRLPETLAEDFVRQKASWLLSKITFFKQFEGNPILRSSRQDYLQYKDAALALARKKAAYFSARYGHDYNKITIRNQKTCWGSCSRKGNLQFNYKLIFLSETLQDYIIVHEICHLKELNHSKKFWALVAKEVPDYLTVRKELRRSGMIAAA